MQKKKKKLNWMISEILVRKRILEGILGNYQMNYITEFDLDVDIVLMIYIFCPNFFFT